MAQNTRIPPDLVATTFENADIVLFDLYRASFMAGQPIITGRAFRNCRIQGPGVMLVLPGTQFESTDFGETSGDVRNLILRPAGPQKVVGTLPVQNCAFIGCQFHGVGFTGTEDFLQQILALDTPK